MEILISALVGLTLMEIYAWLDPLAKWLVKQVVQTLPDAYQAEFSEQFIADLDALPNSIAKVFYAVRDCTFCAKNIQEAAARRALSDIAEHYESTLEKFTLAKASINQTRSSFESHWGTSFKFVITVDRTLQKMRNHAASERPEAKAAIEKFVSTSAPLIEYFSATKDIFERRTSVLEAALETMIEAYSKLRALIEKLRERLVDPRPLDDDDEALIDSLAQALGEVSPTVKAEDFTQPNFYFPERPVDFLDRLKSVSEAAATAVQVLQRKAGQ